MENRPGRSLRAALATSTAGMALFKLFGATGGVLSARLLGPGGKGQYAVLVLLGSAAGTLCTAGLQFWIAREIATSGDAAPVRPVLRRHVAMAAAVTAATTALLVVALRSFGSVTSAEVLAAGLLCLATAAGLLHLAVPNGSLDMKTVAVATVTSAIVYIAWVVAMMLAGIQSVAWVLVGAAVSNAAVIPFCRPLVRRLGGGGTEQAADVRSAHRQARRFGLPGALGELVMLAAFRLDVLVVALLLDKEQAGLYAVALALVETLWLLPDAVAQVVLPHVARTPHRNDTGRLVRFVLVAVALGGTALLVLDGVVISLLFGDQFAGASSAIPFLVGGAAAIGIWKIVAADVVARGNSKGRLTSALTGVVVMLSADAVLIPAFGIAGAALGSAAGYVAALVHICLVWQRVTGRPLHHLFRPGPDGVTGPPAPSTGSADPIPASVAR